MTILSGWREQYERMRRSYDWLSAIATGQVEASSEEARDVLFHFFQDAYHVKDWIKNDHTGMVSQSSKIRAEHLFDSQKNRGVLPLCRDLCNGTKHFGLDPKRKSGTGDPSTAFTSQSVAMRPATVRAVATRSDSGLRLTNVESESPRPALHSWNAESSGQLYDAVRLASDVVDVWEQWLRKEGLPP